MILFCEFATLLFGRSLCTAHRLVEVLEEFPRLELVMIRWTMPGFRNIDHVQRALPPALARRVTAVAPCPLNSQVLREKEVRAYLRKSHDMFWTLIAPERNGGGYLDIAAMFGAPVILCRHGLNTDAAARLRLALRTLAECEAKQLTTAISSERVRDAAIR